MIEAKAIVWLPFVAAGMIASAVEDIGLSNIVALAIVALGGLITIRLNIGKTWQANYEAEKESNRLKDEKNEALSKENVALTTQLQVLEARTDLTPLTENVGMLAQALKSHEERASERHGQVMEAMHEVVQDLRSLRQ